MYLEASPGPRDTDAWDSSLPSFRKTGDTTLPLHHTLPRLPPLTPREPQRKPNALVISGSSCLGTGPSSLLHHWKGVQCLLLCPEDGLLLWFRALETKLPCLAVTRLGLKLPRPLLSSPVLKSAVLPRARYKGGDRNDSYFPICYSSRVIAAPAA